jgi:hypothetical protein
VNRAAANGDRVTLHKYCTDTAGTINFDIDEKAWCKDHNLFRGRTSPRYHWWRETTTD